MIVKEKVEKYLRENGFDGLFCEDDPCACLLEDLMPCDLRYEQRCTAGYKTPCDGGKAISCDGDCGFHIMRHKPTDPEQVE